MSRPFFKAGPVLALGIFVTCPHCAVAQVQGELEITRVYPLTIAQRRLEQSKAPPPVMRPEEEAKRKIPKIVGGLPAAKGQFPWQAALISSNAAKDDPFPGFFCGGSLIDWRWVLTAAHCIYDYDPSGKPMPIKAEAVHVYLGTHDFSGGQRLEVKRIIPHGAYNLDTQDNDIALLELGNEPDDKTGLALLSLIKDGDDTPVQPEKFATVVGWGSTEPGVIPVKMRKSVQTLQYIEDVTFHAPKACNSEHLKNKRAWTRSRLQQKGRAENEINTLLNKWYPPGSTVVTVNMVCAGTNNGTKDACFGDSGGPLVVQRGDQRVQVGIVSWGPPDGCGLNALYGVFTRLSRYGDWLKKKMR